MSSGFVSAGVEGEDYEGSKPNDEWLKVKQELEESRQRRAAEGQQEGGKSLYEVLQQNKGMARIKNAGVNVPIQLQSATLLYFLLVLTDMDYTSCQTRGVRGINTAEEPVSNPG